MASLLKIPIWHLIMLNNSKLKLTAVIPTRCRPVDLIIAVKTILDQTRTPDELIVIDQSPTAESKMEVEALFAEVHPPFNLIYVHDSSISGLVDAKNEAVKVSSGDIVSFLEDDIELYPDYFSEVELFFLNNSTALGCGGVVVKVDCYSSFYRFVFNLIHRGIFFDARVMMHAQEGSQQLMQSRYISGGVSSYRRAVFDQVPFDIVNGFFALEDIEFSTRAADFFGDGYFFINPRIKLLHNMSPANRAVMGVVWERKIREFVLFYKKHADKSGSGINLAALLAGLFCVSALVSVKKLSVAPLTGFFKGLRNGVKQNIKSLSTVECNNLRG